MQKLSDITKTIQEKTAKEAERIEKIASEELQTLEQSLRVELKQSENTIRTAIQEQRNNLTAELKIYTKGKNLLLIGLGVLISITVILGISNFWLYNSLENKKDELRLIESKINQTPLEQQLLARVSVVKWESEKDGIALIPKVKVTWAKTDDGESGLFLERK